MAGQHKAYLLRVAQCLQQVQVFLAGNAKDELHSLVLE
jgi:hypothetical protein